MMTVSEVPKEVSIPGFQEAWDPVKASDFLSENSKATPDNGNICLDGATNRARFCVELLAAILTS